VLADESCGLSNAPVLTPAPLLNWLVLNELRTRANDPESASTAPLEPGKLVLFLPVLT